MSHKLFTLHTAALLATLLLHVTPLQAQPTRDSENPLTLSIFVAAQVPFTLEELQRALAVRTVDFVFGSLDLPNGWSIRADASDTLVRVELRGGRVPNTFHRVVDVGSTDGSAAARLVALCLIDDLKAIARGETPPIERRPITPAPAPAPGEKPPSLPPVSSLSLATTAGPMVLLQDGSVLPGFLLGVHLLPMPSLQTSLSTALFVRQNIDTADERFKLRRIPVWVAVGTAFPLTSSVSLEGECHLGLDFLAAGEGGFLAKGKSNLVLPHTGISAGMTYQISDSLSLSALVGATVLSRRVEYHFNGSFLHRTDWVRGRLLVTVDVRPWQW